MNRKVELLDSRVEHFTETVNRMEKQIKENGDKLKRLVDDHVQILLQKLNLTRNGEFEGNGEC